MTDPTPHNRRTTDRQPGRASHSDSSSDFDNADWAHNRSNDRTASNDRAASRPAHPPSDTAAEPERPIHVTPAQLAQLIDPHPAVRDRYWLSRHYVAASTLVTYTITTLSPASLNARALDAVGSSGWWFVGLMAALSVLTLVESFVTAFVPGVGCNWLRNRRHVLFMGIAMGQLCLAYIVLAHASSSAALLLRFTLDASVATLVAFNDLFARHRHRAASA